MNEFEQHLRRFSSTTGFHIPILGEQLVLPHIMACKNYTVLVHKIMVYA